MFSKIFVRSVLVAIIAAMVWSLSKTWTTSEFQNLAQRVTLSIIESSVFFLGSEMVSIFTFMFG